MNNFKNNIINFILGYNKELDESIKYKIVYAPAVCLKKTGDLIDLYVINLNDMSLYIFDNKKKEGKDRYIIQIKNEKDDTLAYYSYEFGPRFTELECRISKKTASMIFNNFIFFKESDYFEEIT